MKFIVSFLLVALVYTTAVQSDLVGGILSNLTSGDLLGSLTGLLNSDALKEITDGDPKLGCTIYFYFLKC